jgi:hypothetical protein
MNQVGVSGGSDILSPVKFPSGQIPVGLPGSTLNADLVDLSSTFGFNDSPHQFNMSFVPQGTKETIHGASGQTPNIDTDLSFNIGSFVIKGLVTHSEYSVSNNGTTVEITLSDRRRTLKQVKITTDDFGTNRASGVVSVPAELRELFNFDVVQERDPVTWEYRKILDQGATYQEIYTALVHAYNKGNIAIDPTKLPSPKQIAANTGGNDASAIRFKFDLTTLDGVISTVLQDSAYDWYWNMAEDAVNVINRKIGFEISESDLFNALNGAEYTSLRFGKDAVGEPSRVRMYGARKQGFWNSALLSPIDGIDLPASGLEFVPAWRNITAQFVDAGGSLRSYVPSDIELKMALAGIEQWTYFKIYQYNQSTDDPPGFGFSGVMDAGAIAAQHPEFQSRLDPTQPLSQLLANPSGNLRLINNRRDATDNWVMNFYNRIRDHTQRHFGRSYVASGILYNQASGYFKIVDAAWANVENQIEGQALTVSGASGPFVQGYDINKRLGPISPFIQSDFRVSAHAVLPSSTLYGTEGESVPTSFGGWSEDVPPFSPSGSRSHYVPVTLAEAGNKVLDPRNQDDLYGFQLYPDGSVWCQFPTIVGASKVSGTVLDTLATLIESINQSTASGEIDLINPTLLITPYESISGVALPIEVRNRYGDGFPDNWASGTLHPQIGEQVAIDEQYAPWNFFPVGNTNSLTIMDIYAKRKVRGLFIDAINSRYAEIQQTGFPVTNFDGFANQGANSSGLFGVRTNGIASINFSLRARGGYVTTYRINDFYGAYTRIPPLGDRIFPSFQGPINPIDFDIFSFDTTPARAIPLAPPNVQYYTGPESYHKRVTITEVNNLLNVEVGGDDVEPERYFGKTQNGVEYPNRGRRNGNRLMTDGTECIDGFLNEGDDAVFHYEEEGQGTNAEVTFYFFTGGHAINARIANVTQENVSNPGNYDIEFLDEAKTNGAKRIVQNVPPLNAGDAVDAGKNIVLATQKPQINPSFGNNLSIANGEIFIQTTSSSTVLRPVQITALSNPGTSGCRATVQEVNIDGVLTAQGTVFSDVVPQPFPHMAAVGMKGIYFTQSVPSGFDSVTRISTAFVYLPIHPFGTFE